MKELMGLPSLDKPELVVPENEIYIQNPQVSIVVPALNEEITIGEFVQWCWHGLREAGVCGEIIIIDSSEDNTPYIALKNGARVLRTPKRGLGQAYLDVIPFVRGKFVIMGDCDLTYDFREIQPFINKFEGGFEYIMGSRFKGHIERGAMPALHRYFGTPLTTWILNRIYGSNFSDIHCGMRGLTIEALKKINLTSSGWEYASEMVLKASRSNLLIGEVPVKFYKDREGRLSHHRRAGFWSPWYAGWINLKVMLVYSPDTFILKPGFLLMLIGVTIIIISSKGGVIIGKVGFGPHMLMLGICSTVLGYSLVQIGIIARLQHGLRRGITDAIVRKINYDSGMIATFLIGLVGILLFGVFLKEYIGNGYKIDSVRTYAEIGLFLIMISAQTLGLTLIIELKKRMRLS
jgi:glycosyltransferase involved in cell wall biosynthesis